MLKKNLFYTLLLSISQFIFPLITFPYSTRILGPQGIGTVNFIDSFTQYFILFSALGIPVYGVREIAKHRNDKYALSNLFSEIFVIHIISTAAFAFIFFLLAIMVPSLRIHMDLVYIGILLMIFSAFSIEWFYGGIEQFSYITLRSMIVRTLSVVALFLILKPGSSSYTYYLLMTFPVGLTGVLNIVNLKKHATIGIKSLQLKKHLSPLLIILSSALAVSVYVFMDNIILGFIKGEEAVGIYTTASKIVKIPFAFLMAINAVIIPKMSLAHAQGKLDVMHDLANKSFAFMCVISLPISMGIALTANFLVYNFAGDKFMDAVPVLQILSPITIFVGLTFLFAAQILTPMGKEKKLIRIAVIGMFFSLITNMMLIPWLSYYGTAITNMLTELLVAVLSYLLVKKYITIKLDYKIFLQCLFGTLMFIPITLLVRSINFNDLHKEIAVILSCASFYVMFVWFCIKNLYLETLKKELLRKFGLIMPDKG